MSGPQFAHIQTWSRKPNKAGQSIDHVIAEANRDPEFSMHVENPAPPRVLLGNPATFAADHAAHVAARSTIAIMADGSEKSRAIRNDRHTMASIVMSYPVPRSAIVTDEAKAKLAAWEKRNLDWLREKYGGQLRVALAHDDETHPHLHAWLLPDDPGADATTLHPGKVAKKDVEARAKAENVENREAVKLGNRALKAAMTVWQDEYHAAVGVPEGLTRSGPKRRRLSREQWNAEKATAKAHKWIFPSITCVRSLARGPVMLRNKAFIGFGAVLMLTGLPAFSYQGGVDQGNIQIVVGSSAEDRALDAVSGIASDFLRAHQLPVERRASVLRMVFERAVDWGFVFRNSVPPDLLDAISDNERRALAEAILRDTALGYSTAFPHYSGEQLDVTDVSTLGQGIFRVTTRLNGPDLELVEIAWIVSVPASGNTVLRDIVIDGGSMLATQQLYLGTLWSEVDRSKDAFMQRITSADPWAEL